MHGRGHEKSTQTDAIEEAKKVARQIIRGEDLPAAASRMAGLTISEFEQIQRDYHSRNARSEAGDSTYREFMGIWKSFLRVCPVAMIQEVNEHVALRYLRHLGTISRLENRRCKRASSKKLSVATIKKHIRHLSVAWNRVREGHHARVGGLAQHQLVQANPWQAIRNNIPQAPFDDEDPVQFELYDNDLGRFLDQFKDRPVGELFIVTSLWCWGRIKEMARMEWSWIQDHYVVIPRSKAKKGRGKVARLPPAIRERLESIRDPKSPYVFASWVEDVKRFAGHPTRIQEFDPDRMVGQMEKLIAPIAEAIGRPELSHHALRRTAMELGEEAELRQAERISADKLQTTVGNKRKNYTKGLGKKAFTLADGLYSNLTTALHDYPALAARLGCEPLAIMAEREAEALMSKLTPLQRQRLARQLLGGEAEGEGHGVA
jgi:integrase